MSEQVARSLLESVLAVEGPRLDAVARGTVQASLEAIRNATEAALISLTETPSGPTRRDYELSFPPASQSVSTSGQRRRVPSPRPVVSRKDDGPEHSDEEARPVFKGRRGR
jgi:hypothetical protein